MSSRTRSKGKPKEIEIISLVSSEDEEEDFQNALSTPLDSTRGIDHESESLLSSSEKTEFCLYITNKNVKVVYLDTYDDSRFELTKLSHFKHDGEYDRFLISGDKSEIVFNKITEKAKSFDKSAGKSNSAQIEKQVFDSTRASLRNGPAFDRTYHQRNAISFSDEEVLNESQYDEYAAHGSTDKTENNEKMANNNNSMDELTTDGLRQAAGIESGKTKSLHPLIESNDSEGEIEDYLHIENSNNWNENSPYSDNNLEEMASADSEEYVYEDLESNTDKTQQHEDNLRVDMNRSSDHSAESKLPNSMAQAEDLNQSKHVDAAEHEVASAYNNGIFKSDNEDIDGKELKEAEGDISKSSQEKSKLHDELKNDLFAFVSSEDEAVEDKNDVLSFEEKPTAFSHAFDSISNKRKASEISDDSSNDLSDDYNQQSENINLKAASALDNFFDDDDDVSLFAMAKKEDSTKGKETKLPSAALPLLSQSKTHPIIVKRKRTSLSSIIGERASPHKVKLSDLKDSKVRVSIISQMTGLEKCILVIDVKQRKPLKSILPKAINAIVQQNNRLPTTVNHDENNCSFYHNQIKLGPHNTINDLRLNSNESTIELVLVSQDKEASLFESDYKLLQTMQQQEEKMKIMADELKQHGINNKDEEWAQKLTNLKEQQIQAEISDGENNSAEGEKHKDGFFNLKLLDKSNKPITVSVHDAMTVQDVFNLYRENRVVSLNAKVVIMFDGDVVELTDILNDLGLEDEDMLEFSIT